MMRTFRILLFILILFPMILGAHCQDERAPLIVEPDDTDQCGDACEHLRYLGCPEGMPLMDGTTCESFCIETHKQGFALAPSCVVTITKCEELESRCSKPRYHQDP